MARSTLRLSRHHNIKYEQLFPVNFRKNSGTYLPLRQRKIHCFDIHGLVINPVDIHGTLPVFIDGMNISEGKQRVWRAIN